MPIQFRCTQCREPIEVDDEHAGQTAACPYCQNLVTVPTESTFRPDAMITARPVDPAAPGETPPPPGGPRPPHVPAPRRQSAQTFGLYALLCTLLAVVLFLVYLIGFLTVIVPELGGMPTGTLDEEDLNRLQEAMTQHPWVGAMQLGALFFALIGFVLGIVSLSQNRRGNWLGMISVGVGGLFVFCFCGGMLLVMLLGIGGG